MTNNGAHDPKERAVVFGIAARNDGDSARLDNVRADFQSSPPRERMQLGVLLEQMCGSGADLSVVQHLQTGEGGEVDPRWAGCAVLVSYLPSEALGAQSGACPWRLLPNGRIEYDYPIAPWPVPFVAGTQLPVVLRIQVWRPPESGYLEGYWTLSTSHTSPHARDRHTAGQARWSLCDLGEDTTSKTFKAWVRLFREHAQQGRPDGTMTYPDKAAFEAQVRAIIAELRRKGLKVNLYSVPPALQPYALAKRTFQEHLSRFGLDWRRDFLAG